MITTTSSVPGTNHSISKSDKRVCKEVQPVVSSGSHRSNTSWAKIEDKEDETLSVAKNINPSLGDGYSSRIKDEDRSIGREKSVSDCNGDGSTANCSSGAADDEVEAEEVPELKECSRSPPKPASFSHDALQAAQDALQDQIAAENLHKRGQQSQNKWGWKQPFKLEHQREIACDAWRSESPSNVLRYAEKTQPEAYAMHKSEHDMSTKQKFIASEIVDMTETNYSGSVITEEEVQSITKEANALLERVMCLFVRKVAHHSWLNCKMYKRKSIKLFDIVHCIHDREELHWLKEDVNPHPWPPQ